MRFSKICLLVSICLALCLSVQTKQHKCVHNQKFKDLKPEVMEEVPEEESRHFRTLEGIASGEKTVSHAYGSAGWHAIRIAVDYTYSNKFVSRYRNLGSRYKMIIRLVQSVRNYFQRHLAVYFGQTFSFRGGKCYNNKIPSFKSPIDLFVTIYPENDQGTDYFAAATSCYLSTVDYRPTIGAYILNLAFLKEGPLHEFLLFSTFAHEFTHILGFSNNLFDRFVQPGTKNTLSKSRVVNRVNIGGRYVEAIVLDQVVQFARGFFNCPNLQGVPLEDDGGQGTAGSHWEKLFLPQEYMNPSVENPGIISEFTFSLLRGSGWYKTLKRKAQAYDWGKNSGCAHFEICPQGQGYCDRSQVGQRICTSEWRSFGVCISDTTFGNRCPVKRSTEHSCTLDGVSRKKEGEYYGPGARCINYNGGAKCHKVRCSSNGVTISTGRSSVTCAPNEVGRQKTTETRHYLICPDVRDFCGELATACPEDCNTRGLCLEDKTCYCYTGFSGYSCGSKSSVNYAKITGASGLSFKDTYLVSSRLTSIIVLLAFYLGFGF